MPYADPERKKEWQAAHRVVTAWISKQDFEEFKRQAAASGLSIHQYAKSVVLASINAGRAKKTA